MTLWDNSPARWDDLSAQFYLTEADVGKPRASASAAKLSELNPYVNVSVAEDLLLTPELLAASEVSVVVLIG